MATKFKSSVEIDGYLSLTSGNWVQVPDGTTAQRPGSPTVGMFRYNTTTAEFEGYFGSTPAWGAIGGGGGTVTEAFKTIAVSGQSDIVADSATDTLNIAAGSNINLTTNAATDTLTIESTGGGGGTVTVQRNNYTGDGATTVYGVSSTIASENNIQIYLDGVYQDKDTYTTSGTNVTFSTAPPNTTAIEIMHYVSIDGVIEVDEFVGDGTTTSFNTSLSIVNENATSVYVSGVYQSKLTYQTTGNNINFTTAPPNGANIEVVHTKALSLSGFEKNNFTGTGSQTAFTLNQTVNEENMTFVFIQGVYQDKSTYSISGATLTFTTAPQSGYTIEVMVLGSISASTNALYTDTFTGNGSTTAYALGITPVDLNAVEVYLNGLYQNVSTLTLSGNTITFATAPPNGVIIEVRSVGFLNSGGTLAPATLTGGTGISVTTNSPNNFTIANTLGAGIDWETTIHTTTVSANPGKGYIVNTTAGEVTVNLPAGIAGNIVAIQDYAGTFDTNLLNIVSNGSEKIQGRTTDAKCIVENATVYLIYQDTTQGWNADNIADNPPVAPISYLVIAGGGGSSGGYQSGGGGAGGYRNSYASETSGGGGSTETPLNLTVATNHTVTVGAGGAGGPSIGSVQATTNKGGDGSDSVFSTITSVGGGGSAAYWHSPAPNNIGKSGGSGGGAGPFSGSVVGDTRAAGTANQGYAGGGCNGYADPYMGGGGGGAGAVGDDAGAAGVIGNGGVGLSSSITGTATFRGGGGGGSGWSSSYNPGTGGNGGGGTGGKMWAGGTYTAPTAGTVNTGGGGGGEPQQNTVGAAGGSGIVILRYSNIYTLTSTSGTLVHTTATDGSDKVTTITAGTGNIQIN